MASGQSPGASLTDWASIATIVATVLAIFAAIIAVIKAIKPIRQFLGQRRFLGWLLTRKDRKQIELDAQNEADKQEAKADKQKAREAATRANLEFELRDNGTGWAELVTRNKGPCEARNVSIYGELSPKLWYDYEKQDALRDGAYGLVIKYTAISPGPPLVERGLKIQNWQILGGLAQWSLRIDWDDDAGNHCNQAAEARRAA